MSIIDTGRQIEPLTGEAILYQAISVLFSRPGGDKFSLLMDPEFEEQVLGAAESRVTPKEDAGELLAPLRTAFESAADPDKTLDKEYSLIFGHTLSNELSPYEMEFLQNDEIFYRTQRLADLQGFYAAFGFEVNSIERADHISVESEFIALLLTKEAYAVANDLGDEAAEVCNSARTKFLSEHYAGWVRKLATNLSDMNAHPFYAAVGRITTAMLT